jgi:hypothetical protein
MRKLLSFAMGVLIAISTVYSQQVTYPENFDGSTVGYSSSPNMAWRANTNYFVSPAKSYWGVVPNSLGQEVILESPFCDLENYANVYLHFKHICKVSPLDTIRIEYRMSGQNWQTIPATTYQGNALLYVSHGFSAASYTEWQAEDSTALPDQSWWKSETFDLGFFVGKSSGVQFRFIIKRGNTQGTQISYGWLLDDIEVVGSTIELNKPLVELMGSYPNGDVYHTGPFPVQARVYSNTSAPVSGAKLHYTSTLNGITTQDSLPMNPLSGDSLWTGNLPAFVLGTEIAYYVAGKDTLNNMSVTTTVDYNIALDNNATYDSVSVNLDGFSSPVTGQILGGTATPVTIALHNKGLKNLTSATIHWTVNGVSQNDNNWTNNLPWDFTTSVNLGNYTPRSGGFDTIKVWVSQPNGVANALNANDTITMIAYGCAGSMSGSFTFGAGGNFTSLNDFKTTLQNCIPTGDITLEFITGTYATLDLTNISNNMNGYTLTLTSQSGVTNAVTIQVAGTGITLNNSNNIVIKGLTINVSSGTTSRYGINFTGACTNVLIRDCRILASTTATATSVIPIFKAQGTTGTAHNISFINNELDGGYYGIQFYAGVSNASFGADMVFDSNIITNPYAGGAYFSWGHFNSISYNRIKSKTTTFSIQWDGMQIYTSSAKIIGNRIISSSTKTGGLCGINVNDLNYLYTQDTALIYNNEIILLSSNGGTVTRPYGIYIGGASKAKIFNNSVHYTATGSRITNGIYVSSTSSIINIQYNNIVMTHADAIPMYLTSSATATVPVGWYVDYNNFQAPNIIGYILGSNRTTIEAWQNIVKTDKHTFRILPLYPSVGTSLQQTNYNGFIAPVHPEVTIDIDGVNRGTMTNMGCYQGSFSSADAMLLNLTGWQPSVPINHQEMLKAVVWNIGTTTLTDIDFKYSVGVAPSTTVTRTVNIPSGAMDTIDIDVIIYNTPRNIPIKVYIDNIGTLTDENKSNDTLEVNSYVCNSSLNGIQKIGTGVGNDFTTIGEALQALIMCGAGSDVTFALETGTYTELVNLTNISNYTNGHTLTLTSQSGVATGTTIALSNSSTTNESAITLNNSNNIVIKNLTVDITPKSSINCFAINFTGACTNVVIRDCRLLSVLNTSAGMYPIYKNTGTGVVDSIFIIHNTVEGGLYGILFYGGINTSAYGYNIYVDSNTVENQYNYGIYLYYSVISSISGNTITQDDPKATSWYGLALNGCRGDVIGNHIRTAEHNTTYFMRGISLTDHNRYLDRSQDTAQAVIANNEIIIYGSNNSANKSEGIRLSWASVKILHNSIYVSGNETTSGNGSYSNAGINFLSTAVVPVELKYNNIVISNPKSFPIFLAAEGSLLLSSDIDYNNLYAPTYIYGINYGNSYSAIEKWQIEAPSNQHLVRLPVSYSSTATPPINLEQTSYTGLDMPTSADIPTDIEKNSRSTVTHIGCYHGTFATVNAELKGFYDLKQGSILGQQHPVQVIVFNGGNTPLTTIGFHWEINGNPQTDTTWIGNIPFGQTDTITIGSINYATAGDMLVEVYIDNLGGMVDEIPENDTIKANIFICSAFMTGTQNIGVSGSNDFTTVAEALNKLITCGANGDVTFALEQGFYPADIDLTGISAYMNGYTLTITSQSGITSDVTITKASGSGTGFILRNSDNIVIRNLTIDLHTISDADGAYGIEFAGACSNVVIRDCHILTNPSATMVLTAPIQKSGGTGIVDNISIIHNTLDGGGYNIYLQGGTSSSNYGTNIVFDSNTLTNGNKGAYFYYTDFKSIYGNTFISRASSTSAWTGLEFSNCNGNVIGNRFDVPGNTVSYLVNGMVIGSHNTLAPDPALIYNNELLLGSTGTSMFGTPSCGIIFTGGVKAKVLYNSIYYAGNVANRGIFFYNSSNMLEFKYNNIVMAGSGAYPLYFEGTGYLQQLDIDYNNLNAPTNVSYIGSAQTTIGAYQSLIASDKNSVDFPPSFDDVTTSLKVVNNDTLQCPLAFPVSDDIEGSRRYAVTQMGAYTSTPQSLDMALQGILNTNALSGYSFDVVIETENLGLTNIDTAILKWSVDGENPPNRLLWTATPAMALNETRQINVGSFIFNGGQSVVTVWIDSVNNEPSAIQWNDTITATVKQVSLAWFTEPLVADTITSLEFDVSAVIMGNSGALIVQPIPELQIETTIGTQTFYNTLPMTYADGKWSAHVPPQYYGSKVVYTLSISDTNENTTILMDSTFIRFNNDNALYTDKNLSIMALHGLSFGNTTCLPDFTDLSLEIANTGNDAFDFSQDSLTISLQVTQPTAVTMDTVIKTGGLLVGERFEITLIENFPLIIAGEYDFVVHISVAGDNMGYDDTLIYDYVSGRFGLPIDEYFNVGATNIAFNSIAEVGNSRWTVIPQGTGADTVVVPQFGDGMLAFNGSVGSITRLYTRQMDLSRTQMPSLSFWYFHDTLPCDDYMDVMVTTDGGASFTTFLSVNKENTAQGWVQYDVDLPAFAIDQCVFVVFEAMERDRNSKTWQYIDRILITAKQDIAITEIILPEVTACEMEDKEIKIVLTNLTDPVWDYNAAPTTLILERIETGEIFPYPLTSGSLAGFASDTITIVPDFDFISGTYTFKAYFSALFDKESDNDTLVADAIAVSRELSVVITRVSIENSSCLLGDEPIYPTVTLYNTGDLDLSNIELTIQVDTGENNLATYAIFTEIYTDTILAGDSATYNFTHAYNVPWNVRYYVRITASLTCDPLLVNAIYATPECVDIKDLRLISIDNPSTGKDTIENPIRVTVTLINTDDMYDFTNSDITLVVENSQGVQTETIKETIPMVNHLLSSTSYTFTNSYTVPEDSVYYLTVYVSSYDQYSFNDTLLPLRRETVKKQDTIAIKGIERIDGFTLSQNIPNPVVNNTRIHYSIPETGEVVFYVRSVSGQLLYSKTIEAASGKNYLDLNTNTFAAGIYIYSIEYKGQRLVKRMIVQH